MNKWFRMNELESGMEELSNGVLEDDARYETEDGVIIADGGEEYQQQESLSNPSTKDMLDLGVALGGGLYVLGGSFDGNASIVGDGAILAYIGASRYIDRNFNQ